MGKILLKQFSNRRIYLLCFATEQEMLAKRYVIRGRLKNEVEFIYYGLGSRVKPYVAERVVDSHPKINNGLHKGGKHRNYLNLTERSNLTALESLQSAITHYRQSFKLNPEYILIVQIEI